MSPALRPRLRGGRTRLVIRYGPLFLPLAGGACAASLA
jgi:hypothetical protein